MQWQYRVKQRFIRGVLTPVTVWALVDCCGNVVREEWPQQAVTELTLGHNHGAEPVENVPTELLRPATYAQTTAAPRAYCA
jgi:hypothetical protein